MHQTSSIKKEFLRKRDEIFKSNSKQKNSLKFSLGLSLLIEEYIRALAGANEYNFCLASAGSFSRRELSPYSDIDLMFISDSVEKNEQNIAMLVTKFWDNGIEVSHTVRDFSDIKKYAGEDLHTFTQFFETRFLLGSEKIYNRWNGEIFSAVTEKLKVKLLNDMVADIQKRYEKYGDSPKVLEPNVKLSAGGLRDFQTIEWMFMIQNKTLLNKQKEETQAETFIELLKEKEYTSVSECKHLLESYKLILAVRNLLHLHSHQKNDRFEFNAQQRISRTYDHKKDPLQMFMKEYFKAANIINRFSKSMIKKFQEEITNPIPDSLGIDLDEDFVLKGKKISYKGTGNPTLSDIIRAFYYRTLYGAFFDETFRFKIVEVVEDCDKDVSKEAVSSVFFREILKLVKNVGQNLVVMNELGVLGAFMPEFKDLVGFMQHGVYHCYTADEHTLITILNLEKLEKDVSPLGKLYNNLKNKEILYLSLLFHDIAKPINISGHEIIGGEMASSIMNRLGYSEEEIEQVMFLVRHHLTMEQVAFRRNLNDPETLNNFVSKFKTEHSLDLLYLMTYADLSAVNPAVWTSWKADLLYDLYRKAKIMLSEKISAEDLLYSTTYVVPEEITKHSRLINEAHVQEHIESINDIAYTYHFSDEEIAKHIEEIQKGENVSTLFKVLNDFTNVTVITKDFPSLLSKICGILSINDANIHDARIFTRKDGLVIDTFNVTEFRTHKKLDPSKYEKIEKDMANVLSGNLQLSEEIGKMKAKWARIENKFYQRSGRVKVVFEKYEKYTIIDIFSPDRLGFLYTVTTKMSELGLVIYFASIATQADDIVDSFYVLDRKGKKIPVEEYEHIKSELTETINQLLLIPAAKS